MVGCPNFEQKKRLQIPQMLLPVTLSNTESTKLQPFYSGVTFKNYTPLNSIMETRQHQTLSVDGHYISESLSERMPIAACDEIINPVVLSDACLTIIRTTHSCIRSRFVKAWRKTNQ
ncbi:hypothetical protein CEXT_559931 [Caerostris extrusa]|uniref:Uncharacterized protein n=1 Tax=Caerostris extrusa TaxID=172846 RepID=A0AAV4TZD4_CAEEX|nr:hypothetical protein CEXT_559931 [Caerostris extrusa]